MHSQSLHPPSNLLAPRHADGAAIAVGIGLMLAFHLTLVAVFGFHALMQFLGIDLPQEPPPPRERTVVEARFVKLGKVFDPRQLPNRRVPPAPSAPRDSRIAVSKNMNPEPRVRPDAGPRDPNAIDDPMRRLAERAAQFAEFDQQREQEGHEEGIQEGTEDTARAGDLYAGQINRLFRNGWTVSGNVTDEELQALSAEIDVQINADRSIGGHRISRPSGNPYFDQSIVEQVERLKAGGTTLPEPPPEVAGDYLGQWIGLRFNGRQARR